MLTYVDVRDPSFSSLTLAWFEDSGWYIVDWSQSEELLFGFQAGCGFVNENCVELN